MPFSRTLFYRLLLSLSFLVAAACSLPPVKRITLAEFNQLNIARLYEFDHRPEEIIDQLNKKGEAVFECRTRIGKIPCYIKVMALFDKLEYNAYEREE